MATEAAASEVEGKAAAGSTITAAEEFESVEFLSHGLFGICQLAATKVITEAEASELIEQLITSAEKLRAKK